MGIMKYSIIAITLLSMVSQLSLASQPQEKPRTLRRCSRSIRDFLNKLEETEKVCNIPDLLPKSCKEDIRVLIDLDRKMRMERKQEKIKKNTFMMNVLRDMWQ